MNCCTEPLGKPTEHVVSLKNNNNNILIIFNTTFYSHLHFTKNAIQGHFTSFQCHWVDGYWDLICLVGASDEESRVSFRLYTVTCRVPESFVP